MITLELLCQWLKDATHDLDIKVRIEKGYIILESETHVYRMSLDGGI